MNYRLEKDTMGEVRVPADRLWGAQTERSRLNFRIGTERMPLALIYALVRLKRACAMVNSERGLLSQAIAGVIRIACDEILAGHHDQEFPLLVWQTGSGTQTNMNVNEVIAHRATALLIASATTDASIDGPHLNGSDNAGNGRSVHANDHVNRSQSSNDVFPSAMHMAAVSCLEEGLLPALDQVRLVLQEKAATFADLIKIGRTHLQDATPLTLGQEISGWAAMLDINRQQIHDSLQHLRFLAIGGTAVGTGLNAPAGFGPAVARQLSNDCGTSFYAAINTFQALSSHDALVHASGALKALAANLMKIANDLRWLASGPRCGLGEITIPANEPGSSIMPGKVNPTQAEAVTMVACQVFGNDATIGFAASQGNFELNVFKPVIIYNFLQSCTLLTEALLSFNKHCLRGIAPVPEVMARNLNQSLMLVTALTPQLGYEKAALIAKKAHTEGISLKKAALALGLLSETEFNRLVRPETMIGTFRPQPPESAKT